MGNLRVILRISAEKNGKGGHVYSSGCLINMPQVFVNRIYGNIERRGKFFLTYTTGHNSFNNFQFSPA